jgi:hypothetical protein
MEKLKNESLKVPEIIDTSKIRVAQLVKYDGFDVTGVKPYINGQRTLFVGYQISDDYIFNKTGDVYRCIHHKKYDRRTETGIYAEVKQKDFIDFGQIPKRMETKDLFLLFVHLEENLYRTLKKYEKHGVPCHDEINEKLHFLEDGNIGEVRSL